MSQEWRAGTPIPFSNMRVVLNNVAEQHRLAFAKIASRRLSMVKGRKMRFNDSRKRSSAAGILKQRRPGMHLALTPH
jgi:hypothetical protein